MMAARSRASAPNKFKTKRFYRESRGGINEIDPLEYIIKGENWNKRWNVVSGGTYLRSDGRKTRGKTWFIALGVGYLATVANMKTDKAHRMIYLGAFIL